MSLPLTVLYLTLANSLYFAYKLRAEEAKHGYC